MKPKVIPKDLKMVKAKAKSTGLKMVKAKVIMTPKEIRTN